jgi:hypothetical protein
MSVQFINFNRIRNFFTFSIVLLLAIISFIISPVTHAATTVQRSQTVTRNNLVDYCQQYYGDKNLQSLKNAWLRRFNYKGIVDSLSTDKVQYHANYIDEDNSLGNYIIEYDASVYNQPSFDLKSNSWRCTNLNVNIQHLYDFCSNHYKSINKVSDFWVAWEFDETVPEGGFDPMDFGKCDDIDNWWRKFTEADYNNICKQNFGVSKIKLLGKSIFSYVCDGTNEAINYDLVCQNTYKNWSLKAQNIGRGGYQCVEDIDADSFINTIPLRSELMNSGYELNIQCDADLIKTVTTDTMFAVTQKLNDFLLTPIKQLKPEALKNIADTIIAFLKGIFKGLGKVLEDIAGIFQFLMNLGENLKALVDNIVRIFQDPSILCMFFIGKLAQIQSQSFLEYIESTTKEVSYVAANAIVGYFTGSWLASLSKNLPEIATKIITTISSKVKGLNISSKLARISLPFASNLKLQVFERAGKGALKAADVVDNLVTMSDDGFANLAKYLNLSTDISLLRAYRSFISKVKDVDSKLVRFTQNTVNRNNFDWVVKNMQTSKWNTDILPPIEVVRMKDGVLTSIDNKRLLASKNLNINAKVIIHSFDEVMPNNFAFDTAGKPRFINPKTGQVAKTYGEAATYRIMRQYGNFGTQFPNGSYNNPTLK